MVTLSGILSLLKTINIVVTCTKQKTQEASRHLQLRNLKCEAAHSRARQWANRLKCSSDESLPAKLLYAGDHWSVARDLPALSTPKRSVNVWVASAGYGLISIDQPIVPYSATFSNPHPDSVILNDRDTVNIDQKKEWWNELVAFDWPRERPLSIAGLASESPTEPLIIVASRNYLHAIYDDLLRAREQMASHDLFSIVSAGTEQLYKLSESLVPANARLQPYVGGVRRSLNVRLIRRALQETKRSTPTLSRLTSLFQGLLENAPELPIYDRTPMTDAALVKYIKQQMKGKQPVTHTRLLRQLRASGRACEQKRFRNLFNAVQETANG